jgi:hypothetical protein
MHPAILAAGIGAVDAAIAGQVVYGLRRDRRGAGKDPLHKRPGKNSSH